MEKKLFLIVFQSKMTKEHQRFKPVTLILHVCAYQL